MIDHTEDTPEQRDTGPFVAFVGGSALLAFVGPSVLARSTEPAVPAFVAGAAAAQVGLLAIWAVLGPQPLLVRWSASLAVGVLLWCVWLMGVDFVESLDSAEIAGGALVLPLILLAVQVPLWILKAATGWRIVLTGTKIPTSPAEVRQFGLQHILGATTVMAVALGLASLALPGGGAASLPDISQWLELMLACLMVCVVSALSTIPCLWAAFVARNKAGGAVVIGVYVLLVSVLALIVLSAWGPGPAVEGLRLFLPFLGGVAAVLLGGLHAARSAGYVLLRPRRMQRAATSGGSPSTGESASDAPLSP